MPATYISCGGGGPDRSTIDLLAGLLQNADRSRFVSQKMHGLLAKINRKDLAILANLVQSGTVIPVAERTYSLREIAELLRHVESGHVRGKVVIAVPKPRLGAATGKSSPAMRLILLDIARSHSPLA